MDTLTLLNTSGYLGLAIIVGLRARRTGQLALHRLALYLLGIAAILAGARLLAEPLQGVGIAWLVVAMLAYPYLLLRFGAAVARRRRGLERAASITAALEVVALVGVSVVAGGRPGIFAAGTIAVVAAAVAHVAVAAVLVRQGVSMASGFLRRRAVLLAASLVLLGASFVVGTFGAVAVETSAEIALVGGALAAVLTAAATSPPRWLQAIFVLRDHDALMAAEARVLAGDDPAALPDLLEGLVRLVGGDGAVLLADGEAVARVGDVPGAAVLDTDRSAAHAIETPDGERWVLTADGVGCHLVVVTGEDPILYGLDVADLVPRTAARIGVAFASREAESRRRAQAQAEQDAAHYREMAELKDDLLSTINHELRTPMTLVRGGLELLVHRWDAMTDDQRRELVARAEDHSGQLMGVVEQVLALAQLRSGEVEAAPTRIRTDDVLDRALAAFADDVRVECRRPGPLWLSADLELLARSFEELVGNALRHTEGQVEVTTTVDGDVVSFVVTDHGDGFDTELAGELARGGHYLHRTTRGLGLGLTLASETMAAIGGRLHVASGPDGTTATCLLPLDGPVVEEDTVVTLDETVLST